MLAENFFDSNKRGKYGSLWRLDPDGKFINLINDIPPTPNGIRFSPDFKKLYFAVTDNGTIYEFDYDLDSGNISNKQIFATDCAPDGITIDSNGNLWNTYCYFGKPVQVFNSQGRVIKEYYLPVFRVISVDFGGPDNKSYLLQQLKGKKKWGSIRAVFLCLIPISKVVKNLF